MNTVLLTDVIDDDEGDDDDDECSPESFDKRGFKNGFVDSTLALALSWSEINGGIGAISKKGN